MKFIRLFNREIVYLSNHSLKFGDSLWVWKLAKKQNVSTISPKTGTWGVV